MTTNRYSLHKGRLWIAFLILISVSSSNINAQGNVGLAREQVSWRAIRNAIASYSVSKMRCKRLLFRHSQISFNEFFAEDDLRKGVRESYPVNSRLFLAHT